MELTQHIENYKNTVTKNKEILEISFLDQF